MSVVFRFSVIRSRRGGSFSAIIKRSAGLSRARTTLKTSGEDYKICENFDDLLNFEMMDLTEECEDGNHLFSRLFNVFSTRFECDSAEEMVPLEVVQNIPRPFAKLRTAIKSEM